MDKQDYKYLKHAQLDPLKPQFSEDVMFSVGRILTSEGILKTAGDALHFCQYPSKWAVAVKELIKEYEENQ
jgi:hypothetical protein